MKLLMMALVGLVLLGGAGAGAYFYFGKSAEASVGAAPDHTEAKEAKKHDDGHGGKRDQSFVEFDPLILPIVDETGVSQVVSMVVVIEATGSDAAAIITKLQPKLKDAYIQEMYGVLNKQAALKGGVVQVGMIKSRLNAITQRVLGEGVASDVLLQVVQQRPI